ncbi:AMP-binding protein [Rhodoblastus acidophilus]|uniref:Long-chain-fatty-acid--CoA ligase n=1 Tax=Candidatus Rhodoblastus alkanivorans TaxID=2954117 RepID=A0ABS9Z1K4_9HYPH|nr:AMP-binding protein [Candidatus Rhodoblastus alkanivorans]MCI4679911.1 AMP-binding protein [Candidatus Rhodoblastus alkanivorans]MCI4681514.1 AMP-binding protein [Candidatus Rhodoblastus alkanivorans]MDI4642562.1 AMP-binding protein [Rhodoblastus acidophilus]
MAFSEELFAQRPWIAHYPPGVPAEIAPEPDLTLVEMWRQSRSRHGARLALESFGARMTYEELGAAADLVTVWLQEAGLAKGDRVAIMSPNVMAYPAILLGILQAGGVAVNVNPLYTSRELEFQIVDSTPRFLFVLENFVATVAAVVDRLKLERIVLVAPGDLLGARGALINFVSRRIKKAVPKVALPKAVAFSAALRAARGKRPRAVSISENDLAILQYTGGTTGSAKGAMLLHRNLVANIVQSVAWFAPQLEGKGATIMVTALPLYHIYALTACFWFQMRVGGACLLIANPRDIPGFVKTLRKSTFHIFAGVNTLYNVLADHPDIGKVDFSRVLFCIAGGMAMQPAVARKWRKLTGKAIIEGYGLSETSPVVCANRPDIEEFSGTVGYPLPSTEISIRNSAGESAPLGEAGEICVRGPQVMAGYWDRPMATEGAMTADGFFRTGDVGVMLPDGQIKIVDRLKDVIIVSGFNVYPNEVEEVLVEHPMVREAAVIGRPFGASGEEVVAFVVPREQGVTEQDLRHFCRERLTGYKMPREFIFREELPKSNVGKVLRRSLKESLSN